MKKACKHIDITKKEEIEPFVVECLLRHKKRHSTINMIKKWFGVSDEHYARLLDGDFAAVASVSSLISEYIVKTIKERSIPKFCPHLSERKDCTTGKVRLIGCQPAMQQFYDYVAVRSLKEVWKKRIVLQQCSSIKGRGQTYGKDLIAGYIRKDNRQIEYCRKNKLRYTRCCKYHVKLDIKKCYPSMDKKLIMELLRHDCANDDILYLWQSLFDSYGRAKTPDGRPYTGLLIGALPSQWISQLVISYIYRYVMDSGIASHMVIFMDDMLILGSNRRKLKKLVDDTIRYAHKELHLTIKPNYNIRKIDEHPIDMMGYVIYASGKIGIRTRNFLHARRLLLRYKRGKFGLRSARRLVSYKGYITHSNSYAMSNKYNAFSTFRKVQKYLSRREKTGYASLLRRRTAKN